MKATLEPRQKEALITLLEQRFRKFTERHPAIEWKDVRQRIEISEQKLWSLSEMEESGGEPDVIGYNEHAGTYIFCDCSAESPKGRRSVCYDQEALEIQKRT